MSDINANLKQCKNKWESLKKRYKVVKDNSKRTGRGTMPFKFMQEMDNILGDKPGTSCTHTISSMDVLVLETDPTGVQKETDSTGGQKETDSTGVQHRDNKNEEDINVFSSLDFVEKVPDRSERMVQGRKRKANRQGRDI